MPATEDPTEQPEPETPKAAGSSRAFGRHGLVIAAAFLITVGALITYGIVNSEDKPADKQTRVPTAEVVYEVLGEGTVDISYRGDGTNDRAAVAENVRLPWKKSVSVPLGKNPTVNIALGETGGQASCTLTISGRHVQRATASGAFGRNTCSGELPVSGASTEAP
ncbi:hypothetical protein [Streptomyces phaeochromogenes]|uniref:hypothetical protein n=1 Tax=Streptomyces phaeochromogenes TaxID=1923 RepID=UPI0033CFF2F7